MSLPKPPTEHSTGAGPKRGGFNVRLVFHTLRVRPLATAALAVLAGAAAVAAWFLLPLPKVTAAVVFQVASQTPTLLGRSGGEGETSFASYKQSQAALFKRRLTLSAALNLPGVNSLSVVRAAEPDPLTWLDQKLKIDAKPGSEFMRVILEGDNGDELRVLLEALSKAYLADVDERHNGERRRRLAKLEDTRRGYQAELDRFHKRIDAIAFALGSKDGPTLVALDSLLQAELRDAGREQLTVRDELQVAELELGELDGRLKKPDLAGPGGGPTAVPAAVVDDALREDPAFRTLDAEVARARQVLAETEKLFEPGTSSPTLGRVKDQLAAAEDKRDKYRADRRAEVEARIRLRGRQALEVRREDVRQTIERLRRKESVVQGRVKDIKNQIAQSNQYRLELENLKRSIEQTEKLATSLGDEAERLKVELGAAARVTLAEEAFVVPGIEGNRRLRSALLGGVGVFFLGFAGLVAWEARVRKVTHADDVTADIGVRLIGTVPPTVPAGGVSSYVLTEAVDTTRTMLLHGTRPGGGQLRTILVTSAVAGEGKTSFSGHLALSLARAGFRTLLIDGDLLSPSAQQLYDLPDGPGFCELLRGEVEPRGAALPSPIPNLSVLPAGRQDLAARQALAGDRWSRIRRQLEAQFDYLVIDTAPLLLVTDTFLLAREADGVVVSVLIGISHVALVTETVTKLQAIGVNVTGAVVNGVTHQAYKPGHAYRGIQPGDGLAVAGDRRIQR